MVGYLARVLGFTVAVLSMAHRPPKTAVNEFGTEWTSRDFLGHSVAGYLAVSVFYCSCAQYGAPATQNCSKLNLVPNEHIETWWVFNDWVFGRVWVLL